MLTGLLFSRAFADPPESQLKQWDPWRMPIGQWGPVFAPTGYVAHRCVIGHCVVVMAAHGVSLGVVVATSLPPSPPTYSRLTPPHPNPPTIPHTPSIVNTDGRKGQQKIP